MTGADDVAGRYLQELIATELGVSPIFDPQLELERRLGFLVDQLARSGASGLVLGISGGVDSSTAGRLCQLAVERRRETSPETAFVAMRLPYGLQADEHDAQAALKFLAPDEVLTVDVAPASDAALESAVAAGLEFRGKVSRDFVLGNIKARQRMIIQYAVAGARNMLVVGTDHAAEAVMGFFTKYGDGACDITPLSGLTKRRVRELARVLGTPDQLVHKVPTADLESDRAGLPDEAVFGIRYSEIDDFLEGRAVSDAAFATITAWHRRTRHKRQVPISVPG